MIRSEQSRVKCPSLALRLLPQLTFPIVINLPKQYAPPSLLTRNSIFALRRSKFALLLSIWLRCGTIIEGFPNVLSSVHDFFRRYRYNGASSGGQRNYMTRGWIIASSKASRLFEIFFTVCGWMLNLHESGDTKKAKRKKRNLLHGAMSNVVKLQ